MDRRRAAYHHGNLRAALIEAGLKLIAKEGISALTLREIAARVGVSRMAPYRHFADKEALLAAISEAGFARFADALEEARRNARGGFAERLRAMALAYVRFAAENPAYYQAMFGSWGQSENRNAGQPGENAARAFGVLEETIHAGQRSGDVRPGDTRTLARVAWAQVHGIAMLKMFEEPGGAKFVELSSDILRAGLAAKR